MLQIKLNTLKYVTVLVGVGDAIGDVVSHVIKDSFFSNLIQSAAVHKLINFRKES